MNCEFCGSTVLPGAKLCSACRSALKRARNDPLSVLQPLGKRNRDAAQHGAADEANASAGDAGVTPVTKRRGITPALVAALAVAICIIGYVALQHRDDGARADPPSDAVVQSSASTAPAVHELSPLAPLVSPRAPQMEPVPQAAKRHAKPREPLVPTMAPLPVEVAAPLAQPLPAPVAMVKPPAAPPDRRTQLRNAFAQCASTDALQQAFCEQRARIDFCDGLAGSVPQCPTAREYGN
ncbi:MAG: hypothetical protein ABI881_16745 [Betaproteobacteria bacterium]